MPRSFLDRSLRAIGALTALAALTACGPAPMPPGDTVADRGEVQNRAFHQFNVGLDRVIVGPASRGYGTAVPQPVRRGVSNFAANLSQPSYVLNNLLQFRIGQAAQNTTRFLINSTIGLGGILDPATAMGVPALQTGFGETLHIYGVPEGDFVMLPVFGPSTGRDTVGLIVDIASNPVRVVLPQPESQYVFGAEVLDRFGDRYELSDTIDSIYFESADGYAQLRSLYLQNRRFELGGGSTLIYSDPYADPADGDAAATDTGFADPYADPYFDPYAR
ncbi:MAG: VacJ family lipoprotein [Roseicyclus sp.]